MDLLDGVSCLQGLRHHEDAHVGRFVKFLPDVANLNLVILDKSVHALANHAQAFLQRFLKGTPYSHYFAYTFHRRAEFAFHASELCQVPARNLANDIVEGRFEECTGGPCDGVLQFEQSVSKCKFGSNKSQWITGRLACQGRGTRETGVDFDDAIVLRLWIEGILHVAFAHDAEMTNNLDSQAA